MVGFPEELTISLLRIVPSLRIRIFRVVTKSWLERTTDFGCSQRLWKRSRIIPW
jgi:hypothetical protein